MHSIFIFGIPSVLWQLFSVTNSNGTLKATWFVLFAVNVSLVIVGYVVLPDRVANKFDLYGQPVHMVSREFYLGLLSLVLALTNAVYFYFSRMKLTASSIRYINIPNKSYWAEHLGELDLRFKNMMSFVGIFTNAVIVAAFWMVFNFHFPQTVPCPRHLLLMSIILLSTVVLAFGIYANFKVPKK